MLFISAKGSVDYVNAKQARKFGKPTVLKAVLENATYDAVPEIVMINFKTNCIKVLCLQDSKPIGK
jgi:hypothetical protein